MTLDTIPRQLRDDRVKFTPYYRGKRTSPLNSDGTGKFAGYRWGEDHLTWQGAVDAWTAGYDTWYQPGKSGLVVLDADVSLEKPKDTGKKTVTWHEFTHRAVKENGPAQLYKWHAEHGHILPPTFCLVSPGRTDKSHAPGRNLIYWQNPDWPIRTDLKVSGFEVKVSWARLTAEHSICIDRDIAVLPLKAAKLLRPLNWKALKNLAADGPVAKPLEDHYAVLGRNNALTSMRKAMEARNVGGGAEWSPADIVDVIKYANSLLSEPMDERRLFSTVLNAYREQR